MVHFFSLLSFLSLAALSHPLYHGGFKIYLFSDYLYDISHCSGQIQQYVMVTGSIPAGFTLKPEFLVQTIAILHKNMREMVAKWSC